eukprot:s301_g4.t1
MSSAQSTDTYLGPAHRRCIALCLVSCVVDGSLDAKAWANLTSPSEKEVFLQSLVTELHGSVVSDAGLKSYALAPSDYNILLSQLKTQLWLCGGDTGRPCDAPGIAPHLKEENWQNVVGGKDPQETAAFAQNLLRWQGMEVSDPKALLAWARSPPKDLDTALNQLKDASFTCGHEAIELLVAAFDDEPSASLFFRASGFRWVVGAEAGSEGQYLRYVRWLAALAVHVIPAVGGVSLAVREEDPGARGRFQSHMIQRRPGHTDAWDLQDQMLGVALLIPPETRLEDAGLAELTRSPGVGLPPFHRSFRSKEVSCDWGRAASQREWALSTITRDTHRQLATMPHWYLWFLAVRPQVQGRRVGTLLLDEIQKLQDRDGLPCYLDSGSVEGATVMVFT